MCHWKIINTRQCEMANIQKKKQFFSKIGETVLTFWKIEKSCVAHFPPFREVKFPVRPTQSPHNSPSHQSVAVVRTKFLHSETNQTFVTLSYVFNFTCLWIYLCVCACILTYIVAECVCVTGMRAWVRERFFPFFCLCLDGSGKSSTADFIYFIRHTHAFTLLSCRPWIFVSGPKTGLATSACRRETRSQILFLSSWNWTSCLTFLFFPFQTVPFAFPIWGNTCLFGNVFSFRDIQLFVVLKVGYSPSEICNILDDRINKINKLRVSMICVRRI